MKILISADPFIPVPPIHYGGIERIIDMLIKEYVSMGHDVTLIAHPDSKPMEGCRFIPYKSCKDDLIKNSLIITRSYLKHKYDVIHSFSRLSYLLPLLPFNVHKVMTYQREPTLKQIKYALQLSFKDSLIFTGCSDYISNQISTITKAYTVYNGVPLDSFQFNKQVSDQAPLVFLGRIENIKGTHIAIEVALKTGRKLMIAGNITDEHLSYFEDKVKPFLNENIQYVGPVDDFQKNELLRNASAFLMPILWDEPFGIVMAEAMACGTPVIGLNRGAVPEIIVNNQSGYVCNNIEEMISAVSNISQINREEVRLLAERKFSSKVIAKNYLKLYNKY